MKRLAAAACLLVACGSSRGGVVLVDVSSDAPVPNIASLRVAVTNAGQTATVSVPPPGAPVTIPPDQTFTLSFGADRRGALHLALDALDAGGNVLASAAADGEIDPGATTTILVTLAAAAADLGARDLEPPPDLALLPHYSVTGLPSSLGGRLSFGGTFSVEGAVGVPGPSGVSSGGNFTVEPLIPSP